MASLNDPQTVLLRGWWLRMAGKFPTGWLFPWVGPPPAQATPWPWRYCSSSSLGSALATASAGSAVFCGTQTLAGAEARERRGGRTHFVWRRRLKRGVCGGGTPAQPFLIGLPEPPLLGVWVMFGGRLRPTPHGPLRKKEVANSSSVFFGRTLLLGS